MHATFEFFVQKPLIPSEARSFYVFLSTGFPWEVYVPSSGTFLEIIFTEFLWLGRYFLIAVNFLPLRHKKGPHQYNLGFVINDPHISWKTTTINTVSLATNRLWHGIAKVSFRMVMWSQNKQKMIISLLWCQKRHPSSITKSNCLLQIMSSLIFQNQ